MNIKNKDTQPIIEAFQENIFELKKCIFKDSQNIHYNFIKKFKDQVENIENYSFTVFNDLSGSDLDFYIDIKDQEENNLSSEKIDNFIKIMQKHLNDKYSNFIFSSLLQQDSNYKNEIFDNNEPFNGAECFFGNLHSRFLAEEQSKKLQKIPSAQQKSNIKI